MTKSPKPEVGEGTKDLGLPFSIEPITAPGQHARTVKSLQSGKTSGKGIFRESSAGKGGKKAYKV
jgi:hypothetical protein